MFPISPLRYPGGKARLASTIAAIMKSAGFGDDAVFVEPFAGGAGAGLTLLFQNRVKTLVLNDFDNAVAAFWTAILNETERFVDAIRTVPLDLDERERQARIYAERSTRLSFELGFAFSTSTEQAEPESQPPGLSEVGVNPDAGNSTIASIAKRRRAASWRSRKSGGKSAFIATTRRRSSSVDFLSFDATRRSSTSTRPISGKARVFTVKRSTKPTIAACATRFLGT